MRRHTGRLLILAVCAVVILCVPLAWVDHGPSWCLVKAVSGHECPGCGMTRALVHASRGDVVAAWDYNWRWVFVAPLLVFLSFRWAFTPLRTGVRRRAGDASAISSPRSMEPTS